MQAYVFIQVAPGKSTQVAGRLGAIEGVQAAHICWGLPDVIVLVEVPDLKSLQEFVVDKIQAVPGVNQTDTHIVWKP
ncbi:MAG: Lrp/AsnC family transcriptional regulator [Terriglobia bacterium]